MEKYLKKASLDHRNNVRAIKGHEFALEFALEIAKKHWTEKTGYQDDGSRYYSTYFSQSWVWSPHVDLSCYLSKIDSLKHDTLELLEAVLDAGWEVTDEKINQEQKFKCWVFKHPEKKYATAEGGERSPTIQLYFYFGASENCRVVGTGEFKQTEITEVICEG